VYSNSIVVLDKNTFEVRLARPTQGVGVYNSQCWGTATLLGLFELSGMYTPEELDLLWYSNPYCPKYNIVPESRQNFTRDLFFGGIDSTPGTNGDVSSVAAYYYEGSPFAVIASKMGEFWMIDLDAMEVKLSKKVSPWGTQGGASPFSMAVDTEHMLAIYTSRGPGSAQGFIDPNSQTDMVNYLYQLPDGNTACGNGMVYAIDLLDGHIVWQWVHPFMSLNEECFDDCFGDGTDCYPMRWFDWDWGHCEIELESEDEFVRNTIVVYPPKNASGLIRLPDNKRGAMIGPSTVNGDLIFYPNDDGRDLRALCDQWRVYTNNLLSAVSVAQRNGWEFYRKQRGHAFRTDHV